MNFWQKGRTASFWAKDVTDAGAFMLGAIVVGKGVGLVTRALPKAALRCVRVVRLLWVASQLLKRLNVLQ